MPKSLPASGFPLIPGHRIELESNRLLFWRTKASDLNRVCIGHSNDDTDLDYLLGMLRKGVWLGLDRYPDARFPLGTPDWRQRTVVVKQLIEAGFGHRIMLSHDHDIPRSLPTQKLRDERQDYNPDGYLFITRQVLPYLSELGASDQDINRIMVENPRQFFED